MPVDVYLHGESNDGRRRTNTAKLKQTATYMNPSDQTKLPFCLASVRYCSQSQLYKSRLEHLYTSRTLPTAAHLVRGGAGEQAVRVDIHVMGYESMHGV